MALKKVLPRHLVEETETGIPTGKGSPINKNELNGFKLLVPFEDFGTGTGSSDIGTTEVTNADLLAINGAHVADSPLIADVTTFVTNNSITDELVIYIGSTGTAENPLYAYLVDSLGTVTELKSKFSTSFPRQFISGPQVTAYGGDPKSPTPAVILAARNALYPNTRPGTIFFTTATAATINPGYSANYPPFLFFYDGSSMTLINNIPISVDLQATSAGTLGSITMTPLTPSGSIPTVAEISTWLSTNFSSNGITIPNGSLVYWKGTGTSQEPDYVWMLLDDITMNPLPSGNAFVTLIKEPVLSTDSTIITETVNGARFTYRILSGTPSLSFSKTNPLEPTLTVAGGTIKLLGVKDSVNTISSVNYTYTFNATWNHILDAKPVVTKWVDSSNQQDTDNTPGVLNTVFTTSQCVVFISAVSNPFIFGFVWTH